MLASRAEVRVSQSLEAIVSLLPNYDAVFSWVLVVRTVRQRYDTNLYEFHLSSYE